MRRGGRKPLPPEAKKTSVPLRLYPPIIAAIPEPKQAWIEQAIFEKMERDNIKPVTVIL